MTSDPCILYQKKHSVCALVTHKAKYALHFVVSYVQPVTQQYKSITKHLWNQNSHYENYWWFPLQKETITHNRQIDTFCCSLLFTKKDNGKSKKN